MNQSEFLAIAGTLNLLRAREKSRVQGAIGFAFASNWLQMGVRCVESYGNVVRNICYYSWACR